MRAQGSRFARRCTVDEDREQTGECNAFGVSQGWIKGATGEAWFIGLTR